MRSFLDAHGVTYPIVFDPGQNLALGPYAVPGLPVTYVINRAGRIVGGRVLRVERPRLLNDSSPEPQGGAEVVTHRLKVTAQLIALACVAGLLALLVWSVVHQQHAPSVGSVAPAFTLRRLEGAGKVSLASYRGKPVVLNFWASWCDPCKSEAAVLQRDWASYHSRGVVFLGVDYHDLDSDARRFVRAHALTFPMLATGRAT